MLMIKVKKKIKRTNKERNNIDRKRLIEKIKWKYLYAIVLFCVVWNESEICTALVFAGE